MRTTLCRPAGTVRPHKKKSVMGPTSSPPIFPSPHRLPVDTKGAQPHPRDRRRAKKEKPGERLYLLVRRVVPLQGRRRVSTITVVGGTPFRGRNRIYASLKTDDGKRVHFCIKVPDSEDALTVDEDNLRE